EERMVIHPLRALRKIRRSACRIELAIDVEADLLWFPLNRKDVEGVAETSILRQREERANAVLTGVSRAVNASACDGRFAAEVCTAVNLSARRPLAGGTVLAEQPER